MLPAQTRMNHQFKKNSKHTEEINSLFQIYQGHGNS